MIPYATEGESVCNYTIEAEDKCGYYSSFKKSKLHFNHF